MKLNQKGFNDVIVMAIISGIVGALFITGTFVWTEFNNQKEEARLLNVIKEPTEKAINMQDKEDDDESMDPIVKHALQQINQMCPSSMFDERENEYEPWHSKTYDLNGCEYDRQSKTIHEHNRIKGCANNMQTELEKRQYNLLNGCLYKDDERVFDRTIHSLLTARELNDKKYSIGESATEWFRHEDDAHLYMFFVGGAGCAGCVYTGPYLKLNIVSGESTFLTAELPYAPNYLVSPDGKKIVELDFQHYEGAPEELKFYIYDVEAFERTDLIYKTDKSKELLVQSHGAYIAEGAIEWIDDDTIKIQHFESDESGVKYNGGQYIPKGDPILISL